MNKASLAYWLHGFFHEWLAEQRNCSRHTVLSYRDTWRLYLRFVAGRRHRPVSSLTLAELTADEVLAFLKHGESERRTSIGTRNCRLAAIRSFYRFVADREPLAAMQCAAVLRIPIKKGPKTEPEYLDSEEVAAILCQPDRSTSEGQRDHALLAFLYNTGARILAAAPYVLCVHPSLPVKSFKEFAALAKARSGQLNYGSGGTGTGPQMAFELMKLRAGLDIVHIPYKGTGPAMTEQIAGQVQVGLFNLIAGMPVVQSGRLRGLAVTGVKRATRLPELPTFTEVGVAGLEDMGGHAMWLPTGVSKEIVARLHQEMVRAVQSPEVKARLEAEGAEIIANTPEQAAAIIRTDLDKWGEVVRKSGITPN